LKRRKRAKVEVKRRPRFGVGQAKMDRLFLYSS